MRSDQPGAEEQPTRADATAPIDLTRPYCYAIFRPSLSRPSRLTYGARKQAPGGLNRLQAAATYEAAATRILHSHYGPLTVYLWQQRDHEHHRLDHPTDAYRLNLGPSTQAAALMLLRSVDGRAVSTTDNPTGAYCACADPECPTPEGRYTHGPHLVDGPGCTPTEIR